MQPFPRFKDSNYCLTCTPSILCPWLLSLPCPVQYIRIGSLRVSIFLSLLGTHLFGLVYSSFAVVCQLPTRLSPVELLYLSKCILIQVYRSIRVSCSSLTDLIPTVVSGVASIDHLLHRSFP